MSLKPIFKIIKNEGKIDPLGLENFNGYLKTLKDGTYFIHINRRISLKNRSIEQNRYYWGVILELIAEHTGYTPEETHEIMKALFLTRHYLINQQIIVGNISSTTLNTMQMEEYFEQIRRWAVRELSLVIPLPNEVII